MLKRVSIFILAGLLSACIDEVSLPIRTEDPTLVVEGLVTNEPPPYYIRLSYTGVFTSSNFFPEGLTINGAAITLTDDTGQRSGFRRVTGQNGLYETTNLSFVGTVGRSYTLTVELPNGKTYRSEAEVMQPVSAITELTHELLQPFRGTGVNEPPGYQIYVTTQDPAPSTDYYRWTARTYTRRHTTGVPCGFGAICNTSCWVPTYAPGVNIQTDLGVNGSTIRNRPVLVSPAFTTGNHYLEVSQYSLSRKAYQFWRRYKDQLDRTGTIFDPLPAPIEGNLVNTEDASDRALGYFGASAVSVKRQILDTGNDLSNILPRWENRWIEKGGCTNIFLEGSQVVPAGW